MASLLAVSGAETYSEAVERLAAADPLLVIDDPCSAAWLRNLEPSASCSSGS